MRAILIFLVVLWIAALAFNHIDAWVGFGIVVADIVGLYFYFKNKLKD